MNIKMNWLVVCDSNFAATCLCLLKVCGSTFLQEFSRLHHHLLRSALSKPWMRSSILSSIRSFSSRPSTAFSCGCGNASMQFSRRGLTTKQHQLLNIVQKQYNGLTVEGRRSLATLAKTLVSQPTLARMSNRGLLHQLTRGMAIKIKLSPKALKEEKYLNSVLYYAFAIVIFMVGMSYAGVPLYRMFCAVSSEYHTLQTCKTPGHGMGISSSLQYRHIETTV